MIPGTYKVQVPRMTQAGKGDPYPTWSTIAAFPGAAQDKEVLDHIMALFGGRPYRIVWTSDVIVIQHG